MREMANCIFEYYLTRNFRIKVELSSSWFKNSKLNSNNFCRRRKLDFEVYLLKRFQFLFVENALGKRSSRGEVICSGMIPDRALTQIQTSKISPRLRRALSKIIFWTENTQKFPRLRRIYSSYAVP